MVQGYRWYIIVPDRTDCDSAAKFWQTPLHKNEYSWGVSRVDTLIGMGGEGGWMTRKFTCR